MVGRLEIIKLFDWAVNVKNGNTRMCTQARKKKSGRENREKNLRNKQNYTCMCVRILCRVVWVVQKQSPRKKL